MKKKIEIRGRFTSWHEVTKEQGAQLARHHLHNLPAIPEAQRPAYIEAHFLRGATCADVLPELTAKNAAPGEYFAHSGAVVCCLRPYALTEEQANENSLLYLDRCEFRTVETGLYCDAVLPGSRTMTTCENWKIYRKEAAAL